MVFGQYFSRTLRHGPESMGKKFCLLMSLLLRGSWWFSKTALRGGTLPMMIGISLSPPWNLIFVRHQFARDHWMVWFHPSGGRN